MDTVTVTTPDGQYEYPAKHDKSLRIMAELRQAKECFDRNALKEGVYHFYTAVYAFDGHTLSTPHLIVPAHWLEAADGEA